MREVFREEGVSEVVGTILVLAITVVLFTTIFAYVQHIPSAQKSAQISVAPNFLVNNGNLTIVLNDKSGTPLGIYNTYFSVIIGGSVYSYSLSSLINTSYSNISYLHNGYFAPGSVLSWSSLAIGINIITVNTTYGALIFSKQYNQIMWQSQNYFTNFLNSFGIISAYVSPSPIITSQFFDVFVQLYSTSSSNATYVFGNLSTLNGSSSLDNVSFQLLSGQNSNIKTYYATILAPSTIPPNATARIVASSLGQKRYDNLSLAASAGVIPILSIPANGVTFQNAEPIHGSNDIVNVIVRNNGSDGASFVLTVKDLYPSGYSQFISSNYANGVNTTFEVGAYSSTSIEFVWINVGGPSPTSGRNILNFSLYNITGVNGIKEPNVVPARSVYVYILPKILLVNEQSVPAGSTQDVYEYYYTAFEYNNYQPTSLTVTENEQVSLSGYDVVVWFTGNNSQGGISSNQLTTLSNFYNAGGKILVVSGSSGTFGSTGIPVLVKNTQNVTLTSGKLGFHHFNATAINYSFMNQNFETDFGGFLLLTNAQPFINMTNAGTNYTLGYYSTNSHTGRSVVVGFEMARLELYQLDFAIDKIMLWLANVTVGSGNQLVLSDIEFSARSPLFDQTVTVSFFITNLSPATFNDVTLEVLVNNQIYQFIEGITVGADGNYTIVKVNWTASPPGKNLITGIVDPFHSIPQINYALDQASSLVNSTINVRFTTLILWVHNNNDQYSPTGVNKTLSQLGIHYDYMNYVESTGGGSINATLLLQNFTSHNLILIDFNNSGTYTSTLLGAINTFLTETHPSSNLYSVAFLGIDSYNLKGTNLSANLGLNWQSSTSSLNYQFLNGTNYDGSGSLVNNFAENATRGYGIIYDYQHPKNQQEVSVEVTNPSIDYAPLFETNSTNPYNSVPYNVYWNGIIENITGIRVAVLPIDWESIGGFIQNHTNLFSPVATYGSSSQYAQYYLMLNLVISLGYNYPAPFPVVLSPDFSINSPYLSLNNHYVISGLVRNLGSAPISVVVQLFEQNALEESQAVYLPSQSVVPVQFIWSPSYASSPKPEPLRFVIFNQFLKTLPSLEAIDPVNIYYFYDNGSTLQNWNHYNVLAYISGEPLFGLIGATPSTNIVTHFSVSSGGSTITNGWSKYYSFSYPYSYYIKDVNEYYGGTDSYVSLALPRETVSSGEVLTLSWEWKYSVTFAQNGLFLMVQVGNSWYQVNMPYNSNPDLNSIMSIHGAEIYETYNGQSGGGTYGWTFHQISTNDLFVMDPSTGLPMSSPINVTGKQVTFYFYYISPGGTPGNGGSASPGNGTYLDNVMLSATNGGNDGWKVIKPGETSNQYGISSHALSYLGFSGSPTQSLIAMYDNVSGGGSTGYPTFTDSLWDNLVTPVIELNNALNASMSITFKANIAQGLYGYGWPPDYFSISISTNSGSTWAQVYSPPTYPTPTYGGGGQAGGGTIYATSSTTFFPANGANSTYWLTLPINLNFFLGLPVYLDFSMITGYGPPGNFGIFSPWHAVGYNSPSDNPFMGLYMTNIFIQGYSQSPYIAFSEFWT